MTDSLHCPDATLMPSYRPQWPPRSSNPPASAADSTLTPQNTLSYHAAPCLLPYLARGVSNAEVKVGGLFRFSTARWSRRVRVTCLLFPTSEFNNAHRSSVQRAWV